MTMAMKPSMTVGTAMTTMRTGCYSYGPRRILREERGVALIVVLLMSLAISALVLGSTLIATNSQTIQSYHDRQSVLENVALAGLEEARSNLNGDNTLLPLTGYATFESNVSVTDAQGKTISGVTRSTYLGPTGITSGQYGVFATVVSVVEDDAGNRVVRRREIRDEAFSKYAYFTDNEDGNIWFGGGDQIFGPMHSNDQIKIHSTKATFHSTVTTAKDVYQPQYGTFKLGYDEYAPRIELPTMKDLTDLKKQATPGKMVITGSPGGATGTATTRIEFMPVDLNGDGDSTDDNEGFMRVYQVANASDAGYVVAARPNDFSSNGLRNSENCGARVGAVFVPAKSLPSATWLASVIGPTRRCYLGGADSLFGSFQASGGPGDWVKWPGTVSPLLAARADKDYLWPINRPLNPSFKGVIYVEGRVAISGVLRGRITLAATNDIVIADDITYATNPASQTCNDILGLFSPNRIIIADNTLNPPVKPTSSSAYLTYDDTKDEFLHSVVLALNIFTVQNYDTGSNSAEKCESTSWGRGCLYLTGGIIQNTRGAVGTVSGTGYLKRYSYDQCASEDPPPYYPTVGHFAPSRLYEVNPNGFDVDAYFDMLKP
jgi:hypothetical protein